MECQSLALNECFLAIEGKASNQAESLWTLSRGDRTGSSLSVPPLAGQHAHTLFTEAEGEVTLWRCTDWPGVGIDTPVKAGFGVPMPVPESSSHYLRSEGSCITHPRLSETLRPTFVKRE